jgi:hypothetical protein
LKTSYRLFKHQSSQHIRKTTFHRDIQAAWSKFKTDTCDTGRRSFLHSRPTGPPTPTHQNLHNTHDASRLNTFSLTGACPCVDIISDNSVTLGLHTADQQPPNILQHRLQLGHRWVRSRRLQVGRNVHCSLCARSFGARRERQRKVRRRGRRRIEHHWRLPERTWYPESMPGSNYHHHLE